MIKLEDRHGDPIRAAFGGDAGSAKVTEGKESLSVDLKSEAGRAIVRRLLATADAFVVGFRPGVAERAGLDYESLAALNPRLVYVHSGGYGTDGPYAGRPLYAFAAVCARATSNVTRGSGWTPSSVPTSACPSSRRS